MKNSSTRVPRAPLGAPRAAPLLLPRLLLLLLAPALTLACQVFVDLNNYNASMLADASTNAAFLAATGQWVIVDNTHNVSDAAWRGVLAAVGAGRAISEDNAWNWPKPGDLYDADCRGLPGLAPRQALDASFQYHEFTADTMLTNAEIANASAACGGTQVVGLTRAYWPGSGWKTRVEQALANPLLLGVAMEMNPDDWGPRNEDDFVKELLASDKLPLFLLPFRNPNPKNLSTEDTMRGLVGFLASRGVNVSDDRLIFVLANYDWPPLDVLGASNSLESALRATMELCGRPAPARATVLMQMPDQLDLANASLARVNPAGGLADATVLTVWRIGDGPLLDAASAGWDVGDWTRARAGSPQAALTPGAAGSSAVSYANGTFGALLSTLANPIQNGSSLGTITIEHNWSPAAAVQPWASASAEARLDMSVLYEAPEAFRSGEAVYSSWSLGLRHNVSSVFVWYETAIFDLNRDLGGDEVWHDTISGDVIVHGVLGAPSAFHARAFDSAAASSAVWARKRLLHFSVAGAHVRAAIEQTNAAFNLTLGTDPAFWSLVHTNIELEGTSGARAGHSLSAMRIMLLE